MGSMNGGRPVVILAVSGEVDGIGSEVVDGASVVVVETDVVSVVMVVEVGSVVITMVVVKGTMVVGGLVSDFVVSTSVVEVVIMGVVGAVVGVVVSVVGGAVVITGGSVVVGEGAVGVSVGVVVASVDVVGGSVGVVGLTIKPASKGVVMTVVPAVVLGAVLGVSVVV